MTYTQPKSFLIVGGLLIVAGVLGLLTYHPEAPVSVSDLVEHPSSGLRPPSPPGGEGKIAIEVESCQVLMVYDGDTIGCDLNGNHRVDKPEEEIRLLGIDTPEMHYSRKNSTYGQAGSQDEPFAKAASELVTKLSTKKTAYLSFDEKRSDKYGRTLAYVSLVKGQDASLCELLLSKGFAKTLFIPPNFRHANHFRAIEHQAQKERLGIWELEGSEKF